MKSPLLRLVVSAFCLIATQLQGQPTGQTAATPSLSQTLTYVKVTPGKGKDFVDLMRETSMKVAQGRIDSGEIVSWTLLRAVMPAGAEARADYLISVLNEGPPVAPMGLVAFGEALKKVGSPVSLENFVSRRSAVSNLVTYELWRIQARVGAPQKGHYLFLNSMKVHDGEAYDKFEDGVWRPLAEAWVKDGSMSGWIYATKVMPSGAETPYASYSVDMFPTWEAAFAERDFETVFAKVHPGLNLDETLKKMPELRTLAKRDLWVVEERIAKK